MRTSVAVALFCAAIVHAHEIGTTRVTATLRNGMYDVEIVTDASSLADKLARPGAQPTQGLFTAAGSRFRERVQIAFDSAAVQPSISYAIEPARDATSVAAVTIHLIGDIPPAARTMTWTYGWTFATYALTIHAGDSNPPVTQWLEGGQISAPLPLDRSIHAAGRLTSIGRYLALGFTHILPNGFDHVLFVLGIYLLSGRMRNVLWQVSAFTAAHSITLGLSLYGVITVSPKIVEPLIAVSIAYVAIENIFLSELKSWRVALVFAFGLLHGMGFAGALKDLGLPRADYLTALLSFNAGVEAGQLAVIATAFLLVGWHFAHRAWYRSGIVVPASLMIACTAVYWTIERAM